MTVFEQAQRYIDAIPGAISGQGGHSQTLNAARALIWGFCLPEHEAMNLLKHWNQTCQPPWGEKELEHKIKEATTKDFGKPKGYLLTHRSIRSDRPVPSSPGPAWRPDLPKTDYDLKEAENPEFELPQGKRNGFAQLLKACFQPGEGVRVMSGITEDGLVGCDPKGGVVLTQEEWLAKLEHYGDINGMYYRVGGTPVGVYLGVNPMNFGGRGRDSDVAVFRHCLLEFDKIPIKQQWLLLSRSNLPCSAVIFSGNKSLHAWVRIDAKDRKEYDERTALVYNHFAQYEPDQHNKNPSRFSRCPDAKRADTRQMLLATNMGCESFSDWSRHLLVQGIGKTYSIDDTLFYNPDEDGMCVAGDQWLRKGGSAILVGPSGIGKSSLGRQLALAWAIGEPCLGVKPNGPLKVLMIQAENDKADLHRMDVGIAGGLKLIDDPEKLQLLRKNLVTNHNVADTGHQFIISLQRLVDHHEPDLVIVDPLLSFIGDDISLQSVVGKFCRNWLNPILTNSQVAFLGIHHTAKLSRDVDRKKGAKTERSMAEWSYVMMGSSELTNWARAVTILNQLPDNTYELIFSKRGQQAQATHPNGDRTSVVLLKHSTEGIFWEQTDPPEEVASATTTEPAPPKRKNLGPGPERIAKANMHEFIAGIPKGGEQAKDIVPRLNGYAANIMGIDINRTDAYRTLKLLIGNHKLGKNEKGYYVKGSNC